MDNIRIFSKGWNFSQDGPGNRLLYHFQGCNLSCPWCSNPEGMSFKGSMLVIPEKLTDGVCPHGAIQNKTLNRDICQTCMHRVCIGKHRNEGLKWSFTEYTVDEIVQEIELAKGLFHSGGGVTITGGEPTLQFNPLKQLLQKMKDKQIHLAIETNGTSERLPELIDRIDLLIMDIKHTDPAIHKAVLGVGNETILANLYKAAASDIPLWVRIPLIPDFNDTEENIIHMIQLLKEINRRNLSVEMLPYHEYGKIKWKQIGLDYRMLGKQIPASKFQKFKEMLIANNIKYITT